MNDETMRDSLWIPFSAVQKPLNAVAVVAVYWQKGLFRDFYDAKGSQEEVRQYQAYAPRNKNSRSILCLCKLKRKLIRLVWQRFLRYRRRRKSSRRRLFGQSISV